MTYFNIVVARRGSPEANPPPQRDDANARLRELNQLIQDLEELTDEEDLLIISPTGPLGRVPVHALRLRPSNKALIQRNPILYSSTAALFRQCQMTTAVECSKQNNVAENPVMFAVYDDETEEGNTKRQKIYEHCGPPPGSFPFQDFEGRKCKKKHFHAEL